MTTREFEKIRSKLAVQSFNLDALSQLASMLTRVSLDDLEDLISQFHNNAGKFPYVDDVDVGAVILQLSANQVNNLNLKKRLLKEAIKRARWCAQSASSGGEGKARKQHLFELVNQFDRYLGCSICRVHSGCFNTEKDYIAVERKIFKLIDKKKIKKIDLLDKQGPFYEEAYKCLECNQEWILSHPDQAYRGGWKTKRNSSDKEHFS